MPELTTTEQMLYATVKLTQLKNRAVAGHGTGFFFSFDMGGGRSLLAIITNKHVVDGGDAVRFNLHIADGDKPSGRFTEHTVPLANVIPHPNPNVDLCVVGFMEAFNSMKAAGDEPFLVCLGTPLIPADDDWAYFDALEEVLMIGCPNGIYDEVNSIPLIRRGITATPLSKDYNGKKEFVVDMACFPGSSGSPVFLYDKRGFFDRRNNVTQLDGQRALFVGVLHAGPVIAHNGQIVLARPPSFQVATMMHLGYAIKASEVRSLEAHLQQNVAQFPQP